MWAGPEVVKGRSLKMTRPDDAHVDGGNDRGEGGGWHDSRVLGLWEETVGTPPRKTQNRE